MSTCSEISRMTKIYQVERNVQRLESEECLPIISPRAPSNSLIMIIFMKKPLSTQRKLLKLYKQSLVLSQTQYEIAIGCLLGDATLQSQDQGKTYRLKFQQSDKLHRDYLFHLYGVFNEWVLSPPHLDSERNIWSFQTISHTDFKKLAELLVLNNSGVKCKKHIKLLLVENHLTPLGLAYWFMDDGGKSSYNKDYVRKGFAFNTHGFQESEVELLCQGLKTKFGLECWPKANKNKHIIVISAKSYEKMMSLIDDFIIPSMRHKLPYGK